jgi:hypothetical protein
VLVDSIQKQLIRMMTMEKGADKQRVWDKVKKRRFMFVGLLLVLGFIGLNLLAYHHARAMMRFTTEGERTTQPEALSFADKLGVLFGGVNIPRPQSDLKSADLNAHCERLVVSGKDGVELACWYSHQGEGSPLVILFHGYAGEKSSLLNEAKGFIALGASVLLIDFRGSGGSSESYTTIGVHEALDVRSVYVYAKQHLNHPRILLFGQSMGAVAILKAIHDGDIHPDGVMLEAVFDTLLHTVRHPSRAMA